MQVIYIPTVEDPIFTLEFKKFLLHKLNSLYLEYNNIPDEAVFRGRLGLHLFKIIEDNSWNFNNTKISHENGSNELEIRFNKDITINRTSNLNNPNTQSLDGKVVNGWSGDDFSNAMSNVSPDMNFNIEKTERPSIIIKLKNLT